MWTCKQKYVELKIPRDLVLLVCSITYSLTSYNNDVYYVIATLTKYKLYTDDI